MKYGNRRSAHIEKLCGASPAQASTDASEKTDKEDGDTGQ